MEYPKRQSQAMEYNLRMNCRCCGGDRSSAVGQAIIVFLMTASMLVLFLPQAQALMSNLPCCSGSSRCATIVIMRFSIVYVLFLMFCAIVEFIKSLKTPTTAWFWFLKVSVLASGCAGSVYIPTPVFDRIWMDFLFFGAMAFIVIEVYVLIRVSYVVIIKLSRMAENGSACARRFQILFSIFGVITPIVGEVLLIYYYPLCSLNLVFLLTNALIPFIACLWSMSDCVKATNGYSGFAQGGIFACFIIFYTWSALVSQPNQSCNPYFGNNFIIVLRQVLFISGAHIVYIVAVFFSYHIHIEEIEESIPSIETSDDSAPRQFKTKSIIREEIAHVYLPQFNSLLCVSTMCYVSISFLHWTFSEAVQDTDKGSRMAMWFQLVGCWLSVLFFIITLYTPAVYGIFPKKCLLGKT